MIWNQGYRWYFGNVGAGDEWGRRYREQLLPDGQRIQMGSAYNVYYTPWLA